MTYFLLEDHCGTRVEMFHQQNPWKKPINLDLNWKKSSCPWLNCFTGLCAINQTRVSWCHQQSSSNNWINPSLRLNSTWSLSWNALSPAPFFDWIVTSHHCNWKLVNYPKKRVPCNSMNKRWISPIIINVSINYLRRGLDSIKSKIQETFFLFLL